MAARAIWKGVIRFGSIEAPVKLYSAVEDRSVHFRLLQEGASEPVEQRMVNPVTDEPVPHADARKGFAIDGGSYVMLTDEELESVRPKPSRDITISRFVKPSAVNTAFYLRPYDLGPDGDEQAYFTLQRALAEEGTEGIAHWVMRNTEYTGVLRAEGDYLTLITLRHAGEVIAASDLPKPAGRAPNDKEVKMAEQLIASFDDEFDPGQYKDEYRERVMEFIAAKAQGKRIKLKKPVEKVSEHSLVDALAASLKQSRKGRQHAQETA